MTRGSRTPDAGWRHVVAALRGRRATSAVQAVKAALAAVLAWIVAAWWLDSPMAIMAPWVAIVLVQSTVYRSVTGGLRQLLAIAVGTVVAAVAHTAFGDVTAALAVALTVTLLLSTWRRFGDEGVYAATTALFVLTYQTVSATALLDRLREALIGAVIAIAVNALVVPPLYFLRSHRTAQALAYELRDLLRGAAGVLRDLDDHGRAVELWSWTTTSYQTLETLRSSASWTEESIRLNPRRPTPSTLRHARPPGADDPDHPLVVLAPAVSHVTHVLGVLVDATTAEAYLRRPSDLFVTRYAEFLDRLAEVCAVRAAGFDTGLERHRERLDREVTAARSLFDQLDEEVTAGGDHGAPHVVGPLLHDGRALLDVLAGTSGRVAGTSAEAATRPLTTDEGKRT